MERKGQERKRGELRGTEGSGGGKRKKGEVWRRGVEKRGK